MFYQTFFLQVFVFSLIQYIQLPAKTKLFDSEYSVKNRGYFQNEKATLDFRAEVATVMQDIKGRAVSDSSNEF